MRHHSHMQELINPITADEDVEKRELLCTINGNEN